MIKKKMYVLVRKDLSETYRCVQGSHSLAQYALEHPREFKEWNNTTLIFLAIWNLVELRSWIIKLKQRKKVFSVFCEPDLDGHQTAIACYDAGFIFRKLHTV